MNKGGMSMLTRLMFSGGGYCAGIDNASRKT
nr:MAG TPA: hypothetical protein [Caudoviricetes sp.]